MTSQTSRRAHLAVDLGVVARLQRVDRELPCSAWQGEIPSTTDHTAGLLDELGVDVVTAVRLLVELADLEDVLKAIEGDLLHPAVK